MTKVLKQNKQSVHCISVDNELLKEKLLSNDLICPLLTVPSSTYTAVFEPVHSAVKAGIAALLPPKPFKILTFPQKPYPLTPKLYP
jgi:hypothetical protein